MTEGQLGVMIPILGIVLGMGIAFTAIVVGHQQKVKRLEFRYRERMAALERGLELPPDDDPSLDPRNARPRHLLRGLLWTCGGAGLAAMLYHVASPREAWIGGLPLAVGLGYLLFYALEGRRESAAALDAGGPRSPA